jgi:hypothetical protein
MRWSVMLYLLAMLLIIVSFKHALIESGLVGRIIIASLVVGLLVLMAVQR